jgi:TetR/AcrR family transcriptional repressor of nem operon
MGIDTKTQLLDAAQKLVQRLGYNAFSYRDLSEIVGVKTSSIHYYFPTKGDLGVALLERYSERVSAALEDFDQSRGSAEAKLKKFCSLLESVLNDNNQLCLCGTFASESTSLPPVLNKRLMQTVAEIEAWLTKILDEGKKRRKFEFQTALEKDRNDVFLDSAGKYDLFAGVR